MPAWAWVLVGWVAVGGVTAAAVAWALRRGLLRFEPRQNWDEDR